MWTQEAYIEAIQLGLRLIRTPIAGFYVQETYYVKEDCMRSISKVISGIRVNVLIHADGYHVEKFYLLTPYEHKFICNFRDRYKSEHKIKLQDAKKARYIYYRYIKPELEEDIVKELEFIINLKQGVISKKMLREFAKFMDMKTSNILSQSELKELKISYLKKIKGIDKDYKKYYNQERHKAIIYKNAVKMLHELRDA